MSLVIKKIGKHKYLYRQKRAGRKVVQEYIGKADDHKVSSLLKIEDLKKNIPPQISHLFWDTSIENIDLRQNATYIIEKVLEYGDINAVEWLRLAYPTGRIIQVLLTSRKLSEKSRNLWYIFFGVEKCT